MPFILLILILICLFFYRYVRRKDAHQLPQSDISFAQRNQLLEAGKIQMPVGGVVEIVTNTEGVQLRTARWLPKKEPKGTILFCQGYSEFIEKYDEVVAELLERNYGVVLFDWRGQGLSTRLIKDTQKGHINSFADFVKDANIIYQKILVAAMPPPYHIMGHSMGGHVALRILQEFPHRYQKAILCAPFLGWSASLGAIGKNKKAIIAVGQLMRWLGFGQSYTYGATPPHIAKTLPGQTSDRTRFKKRMDFYEKESHLLMGGPTWGWMLAATKSLELILQSKRLQQLKTPILLASGAKDEIIDPQIHHQVAATSQYFSLHDFPESMHEILMEQDAIRNEFWKVFDEWMDG